MKKKFFVGVTVEYDPGYVVEVDVIAGDMSRAEEEARVKAELLASKDFNFHTTQKTRCFPTSISAWNVEKFE